MRSLPVLFILAIGLAACGSSDTVPLSEVEGGIKPDLQAKVQRSPGLSDATVSKVTCVSKGKHEARCLAEFAGTAAQLPLAVTLDGSKYIWEAEGGDTAAAVSALFEDVGANTSTNPATDSGKREVDPTRLVTALGDIDEGITDAAISDGTLHLVAALKAPTEALDTLFTGSACERLLSTFDISAVDIAYTDFGQTSEEPTLVCP